jgi:hypothetical protein
MTRYDATRWLMLATTLGAGVALTRIRPTPAELAAVSTAGAPAAVADMSATRG